MSRLVVCAVSMAVSSIASAQSSIDQHGLCNQSNSGMGNNIQNCYFVVPQRKDMLPSHRTIVVPRPRNRPSVVSDKCVPGSETTVKSRTIVAGLPGDMEAEGKVASPGDRLIVRFAIGDRCIFHYCSPYSHSCIDGSVPISAIYGESFVRQAKEAFEICKNRQGNAEIDRCMRERGVSKP